jgi:Fe-S oxidoreductase
LAAFIVAFACPPAQLINIWAMKTISREPDLSDARRGRRASESDSASFARHIDLCLDAEPAKLACPAGVRYGLLLESARETILDQKKQHGATFQKTMLKIGAPACLSISNRLERIFLVLSAFCGITR